MTSRAQTEIRAYGIRVLQSRHPEIRRLKRLHADINKVDVATLHQKFNKLKKTDLQDIDVVIGADICFLG